MSAENEKLETVTGGATSIVNGANSVTHLDDLCTPLKNNLAFKVPDVRANRVRSFVPSEDEDSVGLESPLRKKQMAEPLMCSTPLKRPELSGASKIMAMRQSGIPVKNLLSDFSTCIEELNISSIPQETGIELESHKGTVLAQRAAFSYLLNAGPGEAGIDPEILNNAINLDDEDSEVEAGGKRTKLTETAIWSLEHQLSLLDLERNQAKNAESVTLSSPENDQSPGNESGPGLKRKPANSSIDSGICIESDYKNKNNQANAEVRMVVEDNEVEEQELKRGIEALSI